MLQIDEFLDDGVISSRAVSSLCGASAIMVGSADSILAFFISDELPEPGFLRIDGRLPLSIDLARSASSGGEVPPVKMTVSGDEFEPSSSSSPSPGQIGAPGPSGVKGDGRGSSRQTVITSGWIKVRGPGVFGTAGLVSVAEVL